MLTLRLWRMERPPSHWRQSTCFNLMQKKLRAIFKVWHWKLKAILISQSLDWGQFCKNEKMCVQSTSEYTIIVALLHVSTLCKMSGSEATNYLPKDQLWPIGQSARESRKPPLTSKSTHFENKFLNKMWSFARDPNLDWYHWGAGESLAD